MMRVHIVGLGLNPRDLPQALSETIANAQVLAGGKRLLDRFKDHPGRRIIIESPVAAVAKTIEAEASRGNNVVVLADGDPLFFGIGSLLAGTLGKENIVIHPNVTVLQVAAARIGIPWHDIAAVSLHGRKEVMPLLRALVKHDRVAVFTDPDFHPGRVADELIRRGVDSFSMFLFENLADTSETVQHLRLEDAAKREYSPLNFVILDRMKNPEIPVHLGMDDELYLHQNGLITKKEIRAAGLAALEIVPHHTIWDLGAGCGSVAIEASLIAEQGSVFAVERNPERVHFIKQNITRTGTYPVEVIHGDMPDCLESLPDPDRIFIGGGIGQDNQVLETAAVRLKPGGRLVVHIVLMGSFSRTREYLESLHWPYTITQVQISRSKRIAGDLRLEALNPVYIVSARKPCH
jgi:precorrin-6Y C5,15-methyltransferase (decarboxylating)